MKNSPITELRGAAVPAALAAAEKRLPAALLVVKGAQNALDIALADGRDTVKYRADLEKALKEKREIHTTINELRQQIQRRNEEKIIAAASAIAECANARRNSLLTRFEFSL